MEVMFVEEITRIIGKNIKQLRDDKGLSLDKLSNLTDVSKSMLGQIERAESSPSINVLWKIATGLKIPLGVLLEEEKDEFFKVPVRKAITADDDKYVCYPTFDFNQDQNFEMFRVELESQGFLDGVPLVKGALEYITVFTGTLTLYFGDQIIDLSRGESLCFDASLKHKYSNETLIKTEYSMMLYYPLGK